jgi:outer membrane protein assembly factor BamB
MRTHADVESNRLFTAIRDRAILRASAQQRLISPGGRTNSWLIDMRKILMDGEVLQAIADNFWHTYSDNLPFQICGMEVASIPILSAILVESVHRGTPINGFIIRKERKTYGTGSLIEGTPSDDPVILVDDIINSGVSAEKSRVVLERLGKKIFSMFVIVDYKSKRGIAWRQAHQIPLVSPYTLTDFDLEFKASQSKLEVPAFRNAWSFRSPDPNSFHRVPKSFPIVDAGRIYFGSDSGIFWCLNALDGKVVWAGRTESKGHKGIWSAPAISDGKVFFGAYDGNVYCLNALTGEEIWRNIDADWVGSSPALAPDIGLLFIGLEFSTKGANGGIAALDIGTGEKVWQHKTKRYTHASPAYWKEKRLVACGSNDDEMFLFDAESGKVRWRFQTRGGSDVKGSIRHAPAFDMKRNQVLTGCADGYIYIIDVDSGKEAWSVKTDNSIYTVPLVVGDLAYIGSTDKHFYILDLDRRVVLEKIFCGTKIFSPASLLSKSIYFGGCNGLIYEINPENSAIIGTHQLPDAITNTITFSASTGLYYALTYMNELFAMEHV